MQKFDDESEPIVVIDIKEQQNAAYRELFFRLVDKISLESTDRNKQNYAGLEKGYQDYDCFHLVLRGEEILAFSGVQSFKYPKEICRLLSRTYYVPEVRKSNLRPTKESSFATKYMLDLQVDLAKKMGKQGVFLSMEFLRRRAFLANLVEYVNLSNRYCDWELLPGMYLTCENPASPNCWQNIAYRALNPGFKFPLKNISETDWQRKFSSQKTESAWRGHQQWGPWPELAVFEIFK